jgi:hypothetical protein
LDPVQAPFSAFGDVLVKLNLTLQLRNPNFGSAKFI